VDANASDFRQVGTGTTVAGNPNPGQIGFMTGDAALAKKSACLLANRVIFILAMKQMIKFILITLRCRMKCPQPIVIMLELI